MLLQICRFFGKLLVSCLLCFMQNFSTDDVKRNLSRKTFRKVVIKISQKSLEGERGLFTFERKPKY